jgi:hypothetical protein
MNHITNDYGKTVIAVGMPGSDMDLITRYPQAIDSIRRYGREPYARAYLLITNYLQHSLVPAQYHDDLKRIAGVLRD